MDLHAQEEIRAYAVVIGEEIVAKWVPFVWEAFLDYRHQSMQLSRIESEIVSALIAGSSESARIIAERNGLLKSGKDGKSGPNRERKELETKMRILGLTPPWE
jgi:thymidylate synthase (FAD)